MSEIVSRSRERRKQRETRKLGLHRRERVSKKKKSLKVARTVVKPHQEEDGGSQRERVNNEAEKKRSSRVG